MRLPNDIKSGPRYSVVQHLRTERGMKLIGRGAFARVYGRDDLNRVVKIGCDDDRYLTYVKSIGLQNRNPYHPKLYSIQCCYYNRTPHHNIDCYYVIEMEKLIPWHKVPKDIRNRLLTKLGIDDVWFADFPRIRKNSGRWEREAITVLRRVWTRGYRDVQTKNIMFRKKGRGYQLVYTDPVA